MAKQTSDFVFTVPFNRDPKFIGRVDTLNKIKDQLKVQRRVALAGIGGVGLAIGLTFLGTVLTPSQKVTSCHRVLLPIPR